jgi:hypothetical protein
MKSLRSPRTLTATLAAALALAALIAVTPARADVGVATVSTHHGAPGATIDLTLGCGFCFPPCVGPKGERHPKGFDHGPCMLGTKDDPPASFGVSLVRSKEAPQRHPCGDGPVCTPTVPSPPHRAPFTFLGRAVPPPGGNDPEGGDPPRYRLRFTVPDLTPGTYTYEIWCGVCAAGRRGALIGAPDSILWRLVVRPPSPAAVGARD